MAIVWQAAAVAGALAAGTDRDRDVAEYRDELRGHTRVLGALRQTRIQQTQIFYRVDVKVDSLTTSRHGDP
ncbi:hypothetical protein [Micromonospora sp. NPDC001898]|uniref:hypothetical protein n=1 Tax=Micromonospora sp. NPDC001898 TaxID=3364221 RepID=UPI0036B3C1F7